jgi:hypothetical protein
MTFSFAVLLLLRLSIVRAADPPGMSAARLIRNTRLSNGRPVSSLKSYLAQLKMSINLPVFPEEVYLKLNQCLQASYKLSRICMNVLTQMFDKVDSSGHHALLQQSMRDGERVLRDLTNEVGMYSGASVKKRVRKRLQKDLQKLSHICEEAFPIDILQEFLKLVDTITAESQAMLKLHEGATALDILRVMETNTDWELSQEYTFALCALKDMSCSAYDGRALKVRLGSSAGDLRWIARISYRYDSIFTTHEVDVSLQMVFSPAKRLFRLRMSSAEDAAYPSSKGLLERIATMRKRVEGIHSHKDSMYREVVAAESRLGWLSESPDKSRLLKYQKTVEAYKAAHTYYIFIYRKYQSVNAELDSLMFSIMQGRSKQ